MTPAQQEECAQRAYEIFSASSTQVDPWSAVKNRSVWMDAVRDHHLNPGAIARKSEVNLQERCVAQAYTETYLPPQATPLVVPPSRKGSKDK